MPVPETKYADRDGVAIAYQRFGTGSRDLIVLPGAANHIEDAWIGPYATFMEKLGSIATVTVYDKAGTGLSDPVAGVPTLDERVGDVVAVMRAEGIERTSLFGFSEGAPTAVMFAATYPDLCSRLILHGSVINGSELTPGWLDRLDEAWGTGRSLEVFGGSLERIAEAMPTMKRGLGAFERSAASPSMFRAVIEAVREIDVTAVLPAVGAPTLVLHRVEDPIPVEQARLAAREIPDARLVELPGDYHHPWFGDANEILDEIAEFLTGSPTVLVSDRTLAVMLFVDIVRSTETLADVGDAGWSSTLDRWESSVRGQIEHHRGRVISTSGDEFFAAFDGPARAAQCAVAIRQVSSELGLTVRCGVHAGECEVRGADLAGLGVHIAARVMAAAQPGEVLVTSTVRDLAAGSGLHFDDRGVSELRGIPDRWHLWAVGDDVDEPQSHPDVVTPSDRRIRRFMTRAPRLTRWMTGVVWRRAERKAQRSSDS